MYTENLVNCWKAKENSMPISSLAVNRKVQRLIVGFQAYGNSKRQASRTDDDIVRSIRKLVARFNP